jgi:hypothetical protein
MLQNFARKKETPKFCPPESGVSFSSYWCNETGNHPQEYLVKFGYIPDMTVEIFMNPFIF